MKSSSAVISYVDGLPDAQAYFELFESTGWNRESQMDAGQLFLGLKQCWYVTCAYRNECLVGVSRLISDGVLYGFVVDVIVHPNSRRLGIGSLLVKRLIDKCREANIPHIQLFCARGYLDFYRKLGFVPRHSDGPGMTWKPKQGKL